jgi:hypothetical protein
MVGNCVSRQCWTINAKAGCFVGWTIEVRARFGSQSTVASCRPQGVCGLYV